MEDHFKFLPVNWKTQLFTALPKTDNLEQTRAIF